ncbi:MAG: oxidoreductase [Rhodovulum sulfidophilum]|uniref:Oxidoreductase n=1 Tax=Rhodovulum sulfidophilum TaxID=35806 RepID=A0A2W5N237_RHOSU|nr:MAG: oxidoreductase [Rhodovulum sulfidophilum]
MTAFPRLLEPITLGKLEIRNRVALTGHGTGMPTDGTPNDRLIAYYEERARGEVGLIMLGSQQVHPSSPGITGLLCNYDDRIIPGLARLAKRVQAHGTRVFGYLSHMGLATSARPTPVWSASAVFEQKYGEVAHAMTREEIALIVEAHALAARRCLEAGLDGIEVHCGHGLLVQQFLSPLTNRREDEYGGAAENRARFAMEILAAVRAAIGPDVPLGIRCSGDELVPGGLTTGDMAAITPLLVAAGALDFVDVSAGTDGDLVSNMLHEPPMGLPPGPFRAVSRGIRDVVDVPVIHGTRIHTAEFAEGMIAAGDADMAGMARALIADPALPRKARLGRAAEITPCVACEQACFGRLYRGRHISCVGQPRTGREITYPAAAPVAEPRAILVIGGGPAGMEAAATAAERGHAVTLIERGDRLGGRMILAALPDGRGEWDRLRAHKAARLAALGVEVLLGTEADPALIAARAPAEVILATGARPRPLDAPGAATAPILTLDAAVTAMAAGGEGIGARVLVIDQIDRAPGMAAALMFARAGRRVDLATAAFHAGDKLEIQNISYFYRECLGAGVTFLPTVTPARLDGGAVDFYNVFTRSVTDRRHYDTIVAVLPGLSEDALLPAIRALGPPVHVIGDAYAPRDIEAAILEGYETAMALA